MIRIGFAWIPTLIYSSEVSYYVVLGGGGGTEVVQLDNGVIITYGYFQVGAGLGGKGAAIQHGDVYMLPTKLMA